MTDRATDDERFKRYSDAAKRRWADPTCRAKVAATRKAMAERRNPERIAAAAAGRDRYCTGRPCVNGHLAERYTSSRRCVACKAADDARKPEAAKEKARQRAAEYRRVNPEKAKAAVNAWRKLHLDELRAKQREDYRINKEKRLANTMRWIKKNPERVKIYRHSRRARLIAADGTFTAADVQEIRLAQKGRCAYCRKTFGSKLTIDHIIAIAAGGTNDRRNIQLACKACNSAKRDRDPIAFAQRKGLLL